MNIFGPKNNKVDPKKEEGQMSAEESQEQPSVSEELSSLDKESSSKELLKLKTELLEFKEKYLRLFADYDNARKRMEKEKQDFLKYANAGLVNEFLNILDDLERSVEVAKAQHQDYSAFLKGIELVMNRIHEMLKKNNVKLMSTKGQMFNPDHHEILMVTERDDLPEGAVVDEFQKGYFLADKVVRTAKVSVAKPKTFVEPTADGPDSAPDSSIINPQDP